MTGPPEAERAVLAAHVHAVEREPVRVHVQAEGDRRRSGRAGQRAFVVEKGTPGFSVGKIEEKMGLRASETAELVLEDCRVPAENLLGGKVRKRLPDRDLRRGSMRGRARRAGGGDRHELRAIQRADRTASRQRDLPRVRQPAADPRLPERRCPPRCSRTRTAGATR